VSAVATRGAVDLVRGRRPVGSSDGGLDVLPATDDPELEVLRVQHREAFAAALQDALAALEPRQRTLLRLYFLEKVTYQALGRVYQVHETTAMRWVEQAKSAVVGEVQRALRKRLNLSESEFDSLAQLMQSQLDISIGRLLSSRHASSHDG
jgi:RNA polymerase sigma-70 factor (ECF subfamily)